MTTIHLPVVRLHDGGRAHGHSLRHAWQQVGETLRLWRRRSRERSQLAGLSEYMLKDIGITRADAVMLSSKPFWKE